MEIYSVYESTHNDVRKLVVEYEGPDGTPAQGSVTQDDARFTELKRYISDYFMGDHDDQEWRDEVVEQIHELFDRTSAIARRMETIESFTDRHFSVDEGVVYLDGEELNDSLSAHIMRLIDEEGSDPRTNEKWDAFSKFVSNLYDNMDEFVRDQLFSWMDSQRDFDKSFTITSDGCFLGYKGVTKNADGDLVSVNSGNARVLDNGEITVYRNSQIPNKIGTTVFMPRREVTNDPQVGCSQGLHVGTANYARGWGSGGALLLVKVNPRDVVSVPVECDAQKLRTASYTILDKVEDLIKDSTYFEYYSEYDDWGEEVDDYMDDGMEMGDDRRSYAESASGHKDQEPEKETIPAWKKALMDAGVFGDPSADRRGKARSVRESMSDEGLAAKYRQGAGSPLDADDAESIDRFRQRRDGGKSEGGSESMIPEKSIEELKDFLRSLFK